MDDLFRGRSPRRRGAQSGPSAPVAGNHRKAICSEIASYAERFRDWEESAMTMALRAHGVDVTEFPPVVMSMIVASLARIVLLERGLGITRGHAEARSFVERYLDRCEMPSPSGDGPSQ